MGDGSARRWLMALLASATLGSAQASADEAAWERAEPGLLARWPIEVFRPAADRLQLKARNGHSTLFKGDRRDGPSYQAFYFAGTDASERFWSVAEQRYEGRSWHWVSRASGRRTEVFEPPQLSPDGQFAVTALANEASGPSGVFVWTVDIQGLHQAAHLEHAEYGLFTFVRWTGSDRAELDLYSHSYTAYCKPDTQSTTARVQLVRQGQRWSLVPPRGAKDVRCE